MADSEVRVDLRLGTDKIGKDLTQSGAKLKALNKQFGDITKAISDMEKELDSAQKLYDQFISGEKEPAALKAATKEYQTASKELDNLVEKNIKLNKQYDDQFAKLQAIRSGKGAEEKREIARTRLSEIKYELDDSERLIEELRPKVEELAAEMEEIKMHPETSQEAQQLSDKMDGLRSSIGEASEEARKLQESIDLTKIMAMVERAGAGFAGLAGKLAGIAKDAGTGAKNLAAMATGLLHITKNSKGASNGIQKLGNRLVRLAKNVFIFSLITKGLRAMRESLANLVNSNVEMAASLNAIKVNLLTAFAPIWEAIQPALIGFLNILRQVTAAIATFFAMLGGKTYAQAKDSAKALYDQAKAIGAVGKAAKGALAPFDEIMNLAQQEAGGGAEGIDFDIEPPELTWMDSLLADFRGIASNIFGVFKDAWDNVGDYFLEGWKHMLGSVWELIKAIATTWYEVWIGGHGRDLLESILVLLGTIFHIIGDIADAFLAAWDISGRTLVESYFEVFTRILSLLNSIGVSFRQAWNDERGVKIINNILKIITNINNSVGALASGLQKAWEANDNGIIIWAAILDMINDVLETIEEMTAATVDWLESLDFEPMMNAFVGLLEAIEPVVDIITDGLSWAYQNVLLPFGTWLIHLAVPAALGLLEKAFKALKAVFEAVRPGATWIWENFLIPLGEWTGGTILEMLEFIGQKFEDVTRWIEENGEDINNVLIGIGEIFTFIWSEVLRPMLDTVVMVVKSTVDAIGQIFSGMITFYSGVFTGDWQKIWDGIVQIFSGAWNGIVGILEGASNLIIKGLNSLINQLNKIKFDVPSWVPVIGGKKWGFEIPNISEISIPRLAKGGIVTGETLATIGERGKEAVLPLDHNTGWAQEVADLIGGGMAEETAQEIISLLEQMVALLRGLNFEIDENALYDRQQNIFRQRGPNAFA